MGKIHMCFFVFVQTHIASTNIGDAMHILTRNKFRLAHGPARLCGNVMNGFIPQFSDKEC